MSRTFPDIINEWTDTLLAINRTATVEQVMLIARIGPLGQRLIYEANAVGMEDMVKVVKDDDPPPPPKARAAS